METVALTVPDEETTKAELAAISKFQVLVREHLKEGHDYGTIQGTSNPTLLKAGAEKITKLLGLADHYIVEDATEDWSKGFFHYRVKCQLVRPSDNLVVSEGLGECNSKESKYRWRWVFPDDVPDSMKGSLTPLTLVKRTGQRRDGKGTYTQYRMENDDIFSQVNTLLKMAKKRSQVDAALSVGRLSEIFTQDLEDMRDVIDSGKFTTSSPKPKTDSKQPPKAPANKKLAETIQKITTAAKLMNYAPADLGGMVAIMFRKSGKSLIDCQLTAEEAEKLLVTVESGVTLEQLKEQAGVGEKDPPENAGQSEADLTPDEFPFE